MKALSLKNISTITKKELRAYFNSPTAYIIIVVFLILWEFLFFRNAFLVGEASVRILFDYLPWLFLLLVPAITMGSISQEKSEGTLELLLTHPIKDAELIAGKFLAAVLFVATVLLFVLPISASFSFFGNLDWGVVFGQYLGGVFLAAVLIALGIFVSSFFASQVSSLLVAVAASFFLIIAGFEIVTARLPLFLAPIIERLSALSHFDSMARGVIDLRDIWYFFSVVLIFLSLTYLQLLKRRFGNRQLLYRSYKLGILLFIGIVILSNVVGSRIPGRLDLTQNRIYTLSEATKKTLRNLNDVVNVTLFASSELPAQFQPVLRDTKDILRDYQTFGQGNVIVAYKDPGSDPQVAQEARLLGISEVQFNVIGQEEFKLKKGYLGLTVSYADKTESIPFLKDTAGVEYQLTSFIRQLTTTEKKKVAFLVGHGEKSISRDYKIVSKELKKQFDLEEASLGEDSKSLPEGTAVLVVAGPTEEIDEKTRSVVQNFLSSGGSALFLIDTLQINPRLLTASLNSNSFADFLKEYGVDVQQDIVYDLRLNETINFSGGMINLLVPYPFWPRVVSSDAASITSRIESMVIPWASSISIDKDVLSKSGYDASVLFTTTKFGGRQTDSFVVSPESQLPQKDLGPQIVALSLTGREDPQATKTGRMIIVGDSDFISDQFVQSMPENAAFAVEAISWLGQEESLAGIQIKQKAERRLLFENGTQLAVVKYGNMLFAFLVPIGFGAFRLIRRRRLRKFSYSSRP